MATIETRARHGGRRLWGWVPSVLGTAVFMLGLLLGEAIGVTPSLAEVVVVLVAGAAGALTQAFAERRRRRR